MLFLTVYIEGPKHVGSYSVLYVNGLSTRGLLFQCRWITKRVHSTRSHKS